jgi:hypothetical protein
MSCHHNWNMNQKSVLVKFFKSQNFIYFENFVYCYQEDPKDYSKEICISISFTTELLNRRKTDSFGLAIYCKCTVLERHTLRNLYAYSVGRLFGDKMLRSPCCGVWVVILRWRSAAALKYAIATKTWPLATPHNTAPNTKIFKKF